VVSVISPTCASAVRRQLNAASVPLSSTL
jgi:hypothetical protein